MKTPHPEWPLRTLVAGPSSHSSLPHPERLAGRDDRDGVVQEAVQEHEGGRMLGQEAAPILERPMARNAEAAAFIGSGNEAEQELGADIVERSEAKLVDHDQIGPRDRRVPSEGAIGSQRR